MTYQYVMAFLAPFACFAAYDLIKLKNISSLRLRAFALREQAYAGLQQFSVDAGVWFLG